ncbi:hypothetical protein [Streptomyces sp. NPDC057582]
MRGICQRVGISVTFFYENSEARVVVQNAVTDSPGLNLRHPNPCYHSPAE